MQEREHTNTHYEQKLRTLKEKLLLVSHKAEMAIADATRSLVERKPSLAQQVVDNDDEVDRLEVEIDDLCFELLARDQPVASDLRFHEHCGNGDLSRRRKRRAPRPAHGELATVVSFRSAFLRCDR